MFPEDGVCLNKLNQHLNTLPGRLTALLVQGTASLGLRYEWTWPLGCAPWMIQWLHHGYSIAGTYIMLIPSYIAVNLSSCTLRPLIRSDYIMI